MMLLKPVLQLRHVAMATAELAATQWWYTSTLGCDSAWLGERDRHHVCSDGRKPPWGRK